MISVIVPIYLINQELLQLTRDTLFSIKGQWDELIIVDDGSPMTSGDIVRQANNYIKIPENQGYIHAVNAGIRAAKGDYICIVCNDTKLLQGNIKDLCGDGYTFPEVEGKVAPFWDGAFYCFPKKIGGLYDGLYQNYFGDLDKFYNAQKQGVLLQKRNSVIISHKQSATTNAIGQRDKAYTTDYERFKNKWGFDPLVRYYDLLKENE